MTKYVEYESVKGSAKGVDTLESFMVWSKQPVAKGKYKILRRFESETPPDGYKTKPTREQIRAAKKAAAEAAKEAKSKVTRPDPPAPVVPTVPTPPEGVVMDSIQDEEE